MMEALSSSEASVITTAPQRNITEDPILHDDCLTDIIDLNRPSL
jgi:hypothetical protein